MSQYYQDLLVLHEKEREKILKIGLITSSVLLGILGATLLFFLITNTIFAFFLFLCLSTFIIVADCLVYRVLQSLHRMKLVQERMLQEKYINYQSSTLSKKITTPLPPIIEAEFYELPG